MAKSPVERLLHVGQRRRNLVPQANRRLTTLLPNRPKSIGRDGESWWNWQPDPGHLGQIGALAAQEITLLGMPVAKMSNPARCHLFVPFNGSVPVNKTSRRVIPQLVAMRKIWLAAFSLVAARPHLQHRRAGVVIERSVGDREKRGGRRRLRGSIRFEMNRVRYFHAGIIPARSELGNRKDENHFHMSSKRTGVMRKLGGSFVIGFRLV